MRTDGLTDRQTDVHNEDNSRFRNFANGPKEALSYLTVSLYVSDDCHNNKPPSLSTALTNWFLKWENFVLCGVGTKFSYTV
jgi:hypothetical protein